MRSQTQGHYPEVRFSDGEKWLFNPILKKRFANRPEERVRLRYVEYLLSETGVTKNRIGFEALVKAYSRDNSLRADLVIFNEQIAPMALIECKSGRIKLDGKTAEQAARYNLTLQADYLMITNGMSDFWYRRDGQSVSSIDGHPFELDSNSNGSGEDRTADYWSARGFLDASLPDNIAGPSSHFLNTAFGNPGLSTISYLNLPSDIAPVPLNHFYRIEELGSDQLAMSVVAAPGHTFLTTMLNRVGQNKGVIWIPLKEFMTHKTSKAERLTPNGKSTITMPEECRNLFRNPSETNFKKLSKELINLFD